MTLTRSLLLSALAAVCLTAGCTGKSRTVTAIAINPKNPNFVYITTNDLVYKTRDAGATWEVITEGMGAARILSLAVHPELTATVYAGTMGDSVYRSMDGGQHWSIINAGMKEHVSVVNSFAFNPKNPDIFYAGTTVGVFKTENGGLMWEDVPNKGMDSVYVVPIILDRTDPKHLLVGTSGGVYDSLDGGQTWKPRHQGMITELVESGLALGVNWLAQDPVHTDVFYAATTNGAYKSVDHAVSWKKIEGGLFGGFISQVLVDFKEPSVLYAGTSEGIYKSTDAGATWSRADNGLTATNVRVIVMHPRKPKTLYAGTQKGLFKTTDGAKQWREEDFRAKTKPKTAP